MGTLRFDLEGDILVACHSVRPPSDLEWSRYLGFIARNIDRIRAVVVHSEGGGPTAMQRRAAAETWATIGRTPRMAVVTGSTVARGIVTASSWLIGNFIRAFPEGDREGVGAFLGLTRPQTVAAFECIRKMRSVPPEL